MAARVNPLLSQRLQTASVAVICAFFLASCGPKPAPTQINDPNEAHNREVHAFNVAVDEKLLKPLVGGGKGLPGPVGKGASNFVANLDAPGEFINHVLQGRLDRAVVKTLRFAVNSTFGIGGLFDPATEMGIPRYATDFGETMHVWGAPEGTYVEVPFFGPSTDRDLTGKLVDFALNPVRPLLTPGERNAVTGARVVSKVGDRSSYSDTVDSVLYDSADSYAQTRLLYLQNRRFTLGQASGAETDDTFIDPYEDPYGQ